MRLASDRPQVPSGRRSRSATIGKLVCGLVLLALLYWLWYWWAADYGYGAVSGTYHFAKGGEQSTLVLSENRTFRQELNRSGTVERAEGAWRRVGEGGVVFSKEFLKVADQTGRQDGQVDGQIKKDFAGLSTSIVFTGNTMTPVFRRKVGR